MATRNVLLALTSAVLFAGAAACGTPSTTSQSTATNVRPPTTQSAHGVQTVLPFTGLNGPEGVATDDSGSVYVVDELGGRLLKLSAGAATQTVLPYRGLPSFVAVDAVRNVYVTDGGNNLVVKFAAGSNAETQLPFSMLNPAGVAVDSTGTVYVADALHDRVLKLAAGAAKPSTLFLRRPIVVTAVAAAFGRHRCYAPHSRRLAWLMPTPHQ